MKDTLTIIILIIVIVQFVYASRLMKLRFSTLRLLLDFIEKERTTLGGKDYKQLVNRYSSVTRLFEPFPDRDSFPILYANKEFETFVMIAKKENQILFNSSDKWIYNTCYNCSMAGQQSHKGDLIISSNQVLYLAAHHTVISSVLL